MPARRTPRRKGKRAAKPKRWNPADLEELNRALWESRDPDNNPPDWFTPPPAEPRALAADALTALYRAQVADALKALHRDAMNAMAALGYRIPDPDRPAPALDDLIRVRVADKRLDYMLRQVPEGHIQALAKMTPRQLPTVAELAEGIAADALTRNAVETREAWREYCRLLDDWKGSRIAEKPRFNPPPSPLLHAAAAWIALGKMESRTTAIIPNALADFTCNKKHARIVKPSAARSAIMPAPAYAMQQHPIPGLPLMPPSPQQLRNWLPMEVSGQRGGGLETTARILFVTLLECDRRELNDMGRIDALINPYALLRGVFPYADRFQQYHLDRLREGIDWLELARIPMAGYRKRRKVITFWESLEPGRIPMNELRDMLLRVEIDLSPNNAGPMFERWPLYGFAAQSLPAFKIDINLQYLINECARKRGTDGKYHNICKERPAVRRIRGRPVDISGAVILDKKTGKPVGDWNDPRCVPILDADGNQVYEPNPAANWVKTITRHDLIAMAYDDAPVSAVTYRHRGDEAVALLKELKRIKRHEVITVEPGKE